MKNTISVEELSKLVATDSTLQLIDVRSPGEYASGHIPRALNIPLEQIENRVDDLGKGPVAILCQSGNRATLACEMLERSHTNLLVVEGGTTAWSNSGRPVTDPIASRWSLERQVRLIAGLMTLGGTILGVTLAQSWVYLAMFVGAGLTFAGLTNVCGMALLLGKLPWNKPAKCAANGKAVKA